MSRQVDIKSLVSHIVRGDGLDKCRICMGDTSQGQVHLTDTVMMDGDKAVTLSELLEVITGVEILEDTLCPAGVCVTCCHSALAAAEFRLLVHSAELTWFRIITNLHTLPLHCDNNAKSLCGIVSLDGALQVFKDYSGGEPKEILTRTQVIKKRERRPRTLRSGPTATCPDCWKSFATPQQLRVHLQNSDQKDACLTCGAVIARGTDMKNHFETAHGLTLLLCSDCPTLHVNEEALKEHKKTAHSSNSLTCLACGRVFRRKTAKDLHTQMHAVLECRLCGKQFSNRSCYRTHRAKCEPDAKPRPRAMPRKLRSNNRDPGKYECDHCGKNYSSRPQLQNHILWIHLGHRPHQCSACGKRFYTAARLAEHTVVHTRVRNFGCDLCPARLVSRSAAIYHRRRHTGEKPYECDDCGATFISSSRRSEHAKRKHNKGVRFQCGQCIASFVRRRELEKHVAKVHLKLT